jgi:hypothetical protein
MSFSYIADIYLPQEKEENKLPIARIAKRGRIQKVFGMANRQIALPVIQNAK